VKKKITKKALVPAILARAHEPWYHVTRRSRLDSILQHGLSVTPPKRTYAVGMIATIGGIYVGSGAHIDDLHERYCDEFGPNDVVTLRLRLHAGTRFCLDEDEIDMMAELPDCLLEERHPELDTNLIRRAVGECFTGVVDPIYAHITRFAPGSAPWPPWHRQGQSRAKLAEWSCRLAVELDQDYLEQYMLRVFDSPKILDWTAACR